MRLEKLELSNFARFKEKLEIEFSKDSKVTIIQGSNGSGKTTLLKAMRVGLGLEKQDEEYGQPQLKCNFDPTVINNENEFLFFNDAEGLIEIKDMNFSKFENNSDFIKEVEILLLEHIDRKEFRKVIINMGKLVISDVKGQVKTGLPMNDRYLLSMCVLIALRKILFPNSFLVIDAPFHNISQDAKERLCHMLLEHGSQLILLVTDVEYESSIESDGFNEKMDSVKTIINNLNPAVNEYRLITNEDQTKIEKCL
jgi:adenylate kinase